MNDEMTILEKAKKAVENFEPLPYQEVDKSLRAGAKSAIEGYKESVNTTLEYLAELE